MPLQKLASIILRAGQPSVSTATRGCSLKSLAVTRKSGMRGASCASMAERKSSTGAMGQSAFACVR